MRVLATGANGHLGANVARALLKRGDQVVPFVRKGAGLRGLIGLGLEIVYGDIMDEKSLIDAAQGCDVLIHMAATYRYWAEDPAQIIEPALVGTRNALKAAKAAGVRRVIFTSSTWAVGLSKDPQQIPTADDWNQDAHNPYAVAKVQSEREAWRLAEELGLDLITLCPGGLLGPYDYKLTPSMSVIRGFVNGTAPIFKGGSSLVDVRSVAEVHAAAVEKGQVGKRYIVAGENLRFEEYAQIITKLTGIHSLRLPGGRPAFQLLALLAEAGGALTNSEPLLTRALADEMGDRYMYADGSNTYRIFGVTRTSTEEAIRECIRWLVHVQQLKPGLAERLRAQFPPDPSWVA